MGIQPTKSFEKPDSDFKFPGRRMQLGRRDAGASYDFMIWKGLRRQQFRPHLRRNFALDQSTSAYRDYRTYDQTQSLDFVNDVETRQAEESLDLQYCSDSQNQLSCFSESIHFSVGSFSSESPFDYYGNHVKVCHITLLLDPFVTVVKPQPILVSFEHQPQSLILDRRNISLVRTCSTASA